MNELIVNAFWDEEAGVWVASSNSNDVPGLVAEAETMDKLVAVLQDRIPELLEANGKQVDEEYLFTFTVISPQSLIAILHKRG